MTAWEKLDEHAAEEARRPELECGVGRASRDTDASRRAGRLERDHLCRASDTGRAACGQRCHAVGEGEHVLRQVGCRAGRLPEFRRLGFAVRRPNRRHARTGRPASRADGADGGCTRASHRRPDRNVRFTHATGHAGGPGRRSRRAVGRAGGLARPVRRRSRAPKPWAPKRINRTNRKSANPRNANPCTTRRPTTVGTARARLR